MLDAPAPGPALPLVIVGDRPGPEEELTGEPFADRAGAYLRLMLSRAGVRPEETHLAYAHDRDALWRLFRAARPRVVVPLGAGPTRLLLLRKCRLGDVAGGFHPVAYMPALVAPWHAPSWLLQAGKSADRDTVRFFTKVLEKVQCCRS